MRSRREGGRGGGGGELRKGGWRGEMEGGRILRRMFFWLLDLLGLLFTILLLSINLSTR